MKTWAGIWPSWSCWDIATLRKFKGLRKEILTWKDTSQNIGYSLQVAYPWFKSFIYSPSHNGSNRSFLSEDLFFFPQKIFNWVLYYKKFKDLCAHDSAWDSKPHANLNSSSLSEFSVNTFSFLNGFSPPNHVLIFGHLISIFLSCSSFLVWWF